MPATQSFRQFYLVIFIIYTLHHLTQSIQLFVLFWRCVEERERGLAKNVRYMFRQGRRIHHMALLERA